MRIIPNALDSVIMGSAADSSGQRRASSRAKMKTAEADIDQACKVSDEEFIKDYLRPSDGWTQFTHPTTKQEYTLSLQRTCNLSKTDREECFEILEQASGPDYEASEAGWHPEHKRKEMAEEDLRYILVKPKEMGDETHHPVQGFASLMPTFEAGDPVVYCYEMQLSSALQGAGLGRRLMELVLSVSRHTPSVQKTMLTCFRRNEGALRFYARMGFEEDETSPRDRKLRSGRVVTSDYVILSCRIPGPVRRSTEGG